ncbi:DUF397 domain-containing protein [Streptosporangium subroseum]|nr:DUF397 domain-containing protein [Streptosporangium subroseum]
MHPVIIGAMGEGVRRPLWRPANLPGVVAVRDSKDPDGPKLLLTPAG